VGDVFDLYKGGEKRKLEKKGNPSKHKTEKGGVTRVAMHNISKKAWRKKIAGGMSRGRENYLKAKEQTAMVMPGRI